MASERTEGDQPDELWSGTAPTPPAPDDVGGSDGVGGPPSRPVPAIGGPPPEEALRLPPSAPIPAHRVPEPAAPPVPSAKKSRRHAAPRPHARRPTGSATREFLLALIVPGSTTIGRAFVLGSVLLIIGVAFPIFVIGWMVWERNSLFALVLDDRFVLAAMVALPAALLARFVAVTEVALFRGRFQSVGFRTLLSYLILGAIAVPIGFGVQRAQEGRELFDAIFPNRPEQPLYVPAAGVDDEFSTVLLLGSDAGPDRFGDRTDTIVIVMVHRASGRVGLVSVPRNTERVPFPPGSAGSVRWPGGFPDLANAIYPVVAADPTLQDGPLVEQVSPAAVGVAQALGHALGVQIDDVVFTDMVGFMELIDVLGGVTVDVEGEILLPPNIIGATGPIPPTVGPGPTEMDGPTAIAFARARYADSDYARMGRQRQLLESLASQTSVIEALWRLPEVSEVLQDSLVTSTTRDGAARVIRALGGGADVVESVGLVPPLVQPGNPNWDEVRSIVAAVRDGVASGIPSGYTPVPEPAAD